MFTRCPACHTLFRIAPKQLKAARGQVRCGSCQAVFDGLESLVNREELSKDEVAALSRTNDAATHQWQLPFDDAPSSAPQPAAPVAMAKEPAPADSALHRDEQPPTDASSEDFAESAATEPEASVEIEMEQELAETSAMDESEPSLQAEEPVEPQVESEPPPTDKPAQAFKWSPRYALSGHEPETVPPRLASRIGWGIGSLVMIAGLAGQLAWFNRDTLALDPRWRPWLQTVCDTAGCTLPALRDPHAIEMVDRNVQSHPQYQGALLITATLVNQATFAQPYPVVELSMTDLDQRRVAARRFLPAEYLDNGHPQGLIPPRASVRLKLEIADPGQEAVGFEFGFY